MTVTVKAYAKINLMLDILSKLNNGYHDLFMLMQSVSLFDRVTVENTDTEKTEIFCDNPLIPTDESNIAYKAAKAFFDYTGKKNTGLKISIEKHIPHSAGLAGGSADGAAVIVALDKICDTALTEKDVIAIGKTVGADVPFCALGGTMLAQYTGTVLSHLPDLEIPYILILKPDESVSTAEAYKAFDEEDWIRHPDTHGILLAAAESNRLGVYKRAANVFEQFVEVTGRAYIKATMLQHKAKCALMSGSGPSIFAVFEEKENAEKCLAELKKNYENVFLCTGIDKGCEIE